MDLVLPEHPLLDLQVVEAQFPAPLGELTSSDQLRALLSHEADAPITTSDEVRKAVRDLLRHGGFKPSGRSKPASEYLLKAAEAERLGSINLAVDLCNVVSLHSGLPISVVDLALLNAPLEVGIAPEGCSFVFNASGQEIDVGGLLCLADENGPCANAVKDSQRTKTSPETRGVAYLIWGSHDLPGHAEKAAEWLRSLLAAES